MLVIIYLRKILERVPFLDNKRFIHRKHQVHRTNHASHQQLSTLEQALQAQKTWESIIINLGKKTCSKCQGNENKNPRSSPPLKKRTSTTSSPARHRNILNSLHPPSLTVLRALKIRTSSIKRETFMQFISLARKHHPDKWKYLDTLSNHETVEILKYVENTRDVLLGNYITLMTQCVFACLFVVHQSMFQDPLALSEIILNFIFVIFLITFLTLMSSW